jgi:hypothetical protein
VKDPKGKRRRRYKENLGCYVITSDRKTSYEDKEVTNENSEGEEYLFHIAVKETRTQINYFL